MPTERCADLMFIIEFQDGTDWFKANWVFKQFAEDIIAAFPNDLALGILLERAQAFGGIIIGSIEPDAATSTLKAMRRIAEETVQRNIAGWKGTRPDDTRGQQMYLESINELLTLLKKQDSPTVGDACS